MSSSQIRVASFDCFGTLIDWEGGLANFLYDMALRHEPEPAENGHTLRERWEAIQFDIIQGDYLTYKAVLAIDNSQLLLRPGMTATAEIRVEEVKDVLLVPNAALRYAPPAAASSDKRSLLQMILPGPPRFRPATKQDDKGVTRRLYVLRDGEPTPVSVQIGASDGRRTEIASGGLKAGDLVVVDTTTSKTN